MSQDRKVSLMTLISVWMLFFGFSLSISAVPGLNEPHYLGKAAATFDPTWCSRDFFLTSSNAHYWFLRCVGPFAALLDPAVVVVAGRLLSMGLLAYAWCHLASELQLKSRWTTISAIAFLALTLTGNFSGEWLIGGFEAKVPSYGFAILGLAVVLAPEYGSSHRPAIRGGLFTGVAVTMHPVVGVWFIAAIATALMLRGLPKRRLVFWKTVLFTGSALLTAAPGLIPAVMFLLEQSVSDADAALANFFQVFWRLRHHLDPMEFPQSAWRWALLLLVGIVIGSTVRWLMLRSKGKNSAADANTQIDIRRQTESLHTILTVLSVTAAIALAGILIGWHTVPAKDMTGWQWRAGLLKFYPFRLFDMMLPITFAICATAMLQSLVGWLVFRYRILPVSTMTANGTVLLLGAIVLTLGNLGREASPPGYDRVQFEDWKAACQWIRKSTSDDALFLTPRESFGFKWYSERAEFVCYKDCPQDAAGILEWNRRLWFLHDWSSSSSLDLLYSDSDLQILAGTTGITHVVTRNLGPFESEPVYSGKVWRVFQIPARP